MSVMDKITTGAFALAKELEMTTEELWTEFVAFIAHKKKGVAPIPNSAASAPIVEQPDAPQQSTGTEDSDNSQASVSPTASIDPNDASSANAQPPTETETSSPTVTADLPAEAPAKTTLSLPKKVK